MYSFLHRGESGDIFIVLFPIWMVPAPFVHIGFNIIYRIRMLAYALQHDEVKPISDNIPPYGGSLLTQINGFNLFL